MTKPDLLLTLLLTQRLLGLGLLLQSVEIFQTRRIYAAGAALAGRGRLEWLVTIRGALALGLIMAPVPVMSAVATVIGLLLLVSTVWLTVRSRGPVCGGSDSMFFQVQLGLLVASLGFIHPLGAKLGLGWIVAQSVLSYFLAGLAKLKNVGWRNGVALQNLFRSAGPYVLLTGSRRLAEAPIVCAVLAWGVLGFELLFPAVLFLPLEAKLVFLALGLAFHIANAALLGLNRFIWAWAATYPALLYFR